MCVCVCVLNRVGGTQGTVPSVIYDTLKKAAIVTLLLTMHPQLWANHTFTSIHSTMYIHEHV